MGLSGQDCSRSVREPFEKTITGREVCPDCADALFMGSAAGRLFRSTTACRQETGRQRTGTAWIKRHGGAQSRQRTCIAVPHTDGRPTSPGGHTTVFIVRGARSLLRRSAR